VSLHAHRSDLYSYPRLTASAMDSSSDMFFPRGGENFFQAPFPDIPATVNPEDLQSTATMVLQEFIAASNACQDHHHHQDLSAHDSGVDLRGQWASSVKQDSTEPCDYFFMGDSPMATNSPSPLTDSIFSQKNSPTGFLRHSSASSLEGPAPVFKKEPEVPEGADMWNVQYAAPDAILIPQSRDEPHISLVPDKTKTRAETQIKMTLTLDPLDNVNFIKFTRKTLAKPKHFASDEEGQEIEAKGAVLHMNVFLVCATAIESPEDRQRALRRAAGTEEIPSRPDGASVADLDKDDPAHPQNGGEVLICEGCKERERKRYDRKKKRGEDEEEFSKYENDRVIMINEKEYKKLREIESDGSHQFSPRARQVEFAMRIACYCRHQEEKTPMGYCVIFTFTLGNQMIAQKVSDVFHITDDHKNKEIAVGALPQPLMIPQLHGLHQQQYHQSNVVVPMYQFPENYGLNAYSQPPTPGVSSQFASPISPMDTTFSSMTPTTPQLMAQPMPQPLSHPMPHSMAQGMTQAMSQVIHQPQDMMGQGMSLAQQARQPGAAFPATASTNVSAYARQQRGQGYYDIPLRSPNAQMGFGETNVLPRPESLDNFNFTYPNGADLTPQTQYFNSAPPSSGGTPLNLSRPASPTWEQGPNKKGKVIRCLYF
jgi:hypothetical protein